jgi:hypothetical protein
MNLRLPLPGQKVVFMKKKNHLKYSSCQLGSSGVREQRVVVQQFGFVATMNTPDTYSGNFRNTVRTSLTDPDAHSHVVLSLVVPTASAPDRGAVMRLPFFVRPPRARGRGRGFCQVFEFFAGRRRDFRD